MTIDVIELAKQNGIQYRLTPDGTTEMWCHDSDVQAFAEAVRAAACAERDARIAELERQLAEARKDADRIDWLTGTLFVARWNGVVGSGSRTSWTIPGDWRYTCATMTGNDLRSAIDAAIDASDAVLKGTP